MMPGSRIGHRGLLVASIAHRWQTQQMGQDLKTKVIGEHYFDVHGVHDPATWAALSGTDHSSNSYRQAWTQLEKLILGVRDSITGAIMDAPNPGF